jgi:hypothetical protein
MLLFRRPRADAPRSRDFFVTSETPLNGAVSSIAPAHMKITCPDVTLNNHHLSGITLKAVEVKIFLRVHVIVEGKSGTKLKDIMP